MHDTPPQPITPEGVRQRAAIAGISIDPEFEDDLAIMLENALAPLRAVDSRTIRQIEPAIAFDAVRGVQS